MATASGAALLTYLKEELDVVGQCRKLRVPLWQCPRLVFIVMGGVIIAAIVATYFFLVVRTEPEMAALVAVVIAGVLLIQSYIILLATENIAETSRLKSEFINITSHQLRSPLTASRWATDLLLSDLSVSLPQEVVENLRIIESSNARMNKLVYSLLQVARIETNTFKQRKREVSLSEVVKEITDEAAMFARASNIDIIVSIPDKKLFVKFDPEQLRFIVQEVLDNAIRYTGVKGTIRVTVSTKNGSGTVEIADQGVGIPMEEQKDIFQKFYRGSNIYTLSPAGTGLSLFIVKKVLEAGGGKIDFKSTVGKGSSFWFTVPTISETNII